MSACLARMEEQQGAQTGKMGHVNLIEGRNNLLSLRYVREEPSSVPPKNKTIPPQPSRRWPFARDGADVSSRRTPNGRVVIRYKPVLSSASIRAPPPIPRSCHRGLQLASAKKAGTCGECYNHVRIQRGHMYISSGHDAERGRNACCIIRDNTNSHTQPTMAEAR